jgi:hypothetical protein
MDKDERVAELEDLLKQRDRRITDLQTELQEAQDLVGEQQETMDEYGGTIERWREAFDMQLTDDGTWGWKTWITRQEEIYAKYRALIAEWNRFVAEYNAVVAPKRRNIGRPLAAGLGQVKDVRRRRQAGQSIRSIALDTNLSERTVRTIIGKVEGSDRATLARLERIAPETRAEVIKQRREANDRRVVAKQVNGFMKVVVELRKRAKGLK